VTIIEGIALIFTGVLVGLVTFINPYTEVTVAVYIASIAMLIILAVVSLFTGFKVNFLPYKLCPIIFSISAILMLLGILLRP